ncbi:Retrotransposable element Tf2 protein [Rhizoctonia solani]|uniref:Retrotransposable element Tf2 protein n=1 Tax=Rhizoctonia solani TaxID=456999 RepID=A0A8H8T1V4_9AGAM|nr:Retrotransposable element Tf2 protein [Rhizoctonia solani]QRW25734.1 Retrotransposable element Tf2 protein [Rhizoctonia solani]
MLATPILHQQWQPVPGLPLEPSPLLIQETWDPNFWQPPLQVKNIEQKLKEVKEAGIKTQTNIKNISQTVNVVKDGLRSLQTYRPRTPETKPPVVEATPHPLPKAEPIGLASGPSFWPKQPKGLPVFAQPAPRTLPLQVPSPPPSLCVLPTPITPSPLPPALLLNPPPKQPPTLDAHTPLIQWQPVPSRPLEPAPLLIKDSWDPNFRQPPLSLAKLVSSRSSASFGDFSPKSTAETPQAVPKAKPIGKAQPFLGAPAPIISTGAPRHNPLSLFNPYPSSSFPLGPAPSASQGPPPVPIVPLAQPPVPSTVKVDHPNAFKGKIGLEAKQWLTRMLAWVRLNQRQFPLDLEVLSFLLMNMEEAAGAWAHPHLDQLGSHCAIIQTVDEFKTKFLAAFGNPDATRAAERKITSLTQTGCPRYKAEHLEVLIDSGATSSFMHPHTAESLRLPLIDLPSPCTVTMLDGSSPQAGKIWKKATLTFSLDGKQITETFLICNTGSHAAILGLKWLDAHNPEINWNMRTLSFPHTPPEQVAIAEEEEADKDPLEGVPPEYHPYAKVFGEEEFNKLLPHWHYNIGIELTEEGPLNSPLYSMTDAKSATLKDWLRDELKAGKICPSKSSISSPVMFVPKKDGSCCLVVDYCCLNNRTKKNVYPLPHLDDLMAQLRGAKVFTKLDLQWGYNNVQVKEGNKWKTTFQTKYGLYESLVMTFGLTNTPAAFQHFMNKLFKDLLDVCVIIYLDNILICSKDNTVHTQHVHKVLQHLMDNQLSCKASKCTFHVTSVEHLGIIVLDKGFSLDKLKIQAVQEWPTPSKVKEVQSFLGFANFLRCFVANFSHIARPLHNLVKKDAPWKWDTKEQEAFQGLKHAITNAPVLCHADPSKPYFLETDASGAALGSILSQQQEDGCLHPLGFLSESFKGAKQNYNTHDKELLAIIRSFEYWRIFLEGTLHPITVFTDHRNLEYWKESCTFNRRHARWHLLLAGYNFQIVYCPGKQSGKPDALSHQSNHADVPPANQTMLPDPVFANIAMVTPEKELQCQIKTSLDQDKSLEEILQFLQNESKAPPSIKRAFKDYKMEAGLLFYQGRIVVPDVGTLQTDLLRIYHNSPLAGHPGRQRTLELILRAYYWPGIQADTYWHVDSCKTCQRIRKPKYLSIPPQPLKLPTRPWQHISYNMIVDLPKDGISNSILVIVDSFTKYVILVECSKKLKAPELADLFLQHVWKQYGMPEKTISDQGRVFNNKFLRALYQRLGIDPHFSSAYHPQSNSQTEQVNPTVKHFLQAYSGINQKDWVKWLPMAEFAYNNVVHSSTGKSPFKALYRWEPALTPSNVPTNVPEANELAKAMEAQWREVEAALQQSKSRMVAGEMGSPIEFEVGEEAWLDAKNVKLKTLSPKLTEQRLGPFKVIEKISNQAYRLDLPPTMQIHNVFYMGLLSKVKRDSNWAFENRPPPVTVDREEEYKVEGITDAEEWNGKWFFRVKWEGYGSKENTWEPQENLKNAENFLEKYEKDMRKKALGAAKALKGGAVL